MSVYKYLVPYVTVENKKINILEYIFKKNTLKFTCPLDFNDPFEVKPHIKKYVIPNLPGFANLLNETKNVNKFYEIERYEILKNVGILSLSSVYTSLTMWAHYANNHQGIVIEFDESHDFFNPKLEFNSKIPCFLHGLKKVLYKQKRLSINSDNWVQEENFLIKSNDWAYENEYRMTIILDESSNSDKYNIKFPSEVITSVYIGYNATQETINYILNLKTHDMWKNLKIYKCFPCEREYKLGITEL